MAVEDYIAKRAESYGVIKETVSGLIPLDFAGIHSANVITAGVGTLEAGSPLVGVTLDVTLKFINGGIASGIINIAQDPEHGFRAFLTGAAGGTLANVIVDQAFGASAKEALAAFLARSTVASGLELAAIGLTGEIGAVVIGEALTTIAKQAYSTFITRQFDAAYDAYNDIYKIETNWNLQDNLYGNMWNGVDYLVDLFRGNPKNLDHIVEISNGFDLYGENERDISYLRYRKVDSDTGLFDVFTYGGNLDQVKDEVSIEHTSDVDAMIDFLEKPGFNLITNDSQHHEVTAFKYVDDAANLAGVARQDSDVLASVLTLQKYSLSNDPTNSPAESVEMASRFSDQMLLDRAEMALANAQYQNSVNQAYTYMDYASRTYLISKSLGTQNYLMPQRSFGGGSNIEVNGSEYGDHLYGAVLPGLSNYDDVLRGNGGNDILEGGMGSDTMYGGDGNDTFIIHGTDEDPEAFDTFNGGTGTDTIRGGDLDDTIRVDSLSLAANSIEVIDGGNQMPEDRSRDTGWWPASGRRLECFWPAVV